VLHDILHSSSPTPILAYVFTWPTFHRSYYMWFLLPQAKIPDELIAREVVINDADPSVRYKLTKRQTQDEVNPQPNSRCAL
jgi:hypothetical protein